MIQSSFHSLFLPKRWLTACRKLVDRQYFGKCSAPQENGGWGYFHYHDNIANCNCFTWIFHIIPPIVWLHVSMMSFIYLLHVQFKHILLNHPGQPEFTLSFVQKPKSENRQSASVQGPHTQGPNIGERS